MTEREPLPVVIPKVPYGPLGVPQDQADADYYLSAAENIRYHQSRGNSFAGSNLTEAVARLCEAVAAALGLTTGQEGGTMSDGKDVLQRRGGRAAFEHYPDTPTWLPGLTMAEITLLWEEHERKKKEETE